MLCEMHTALSKIWTQADVSISYEHNHDTISRLRSIQKSSNYEGLVILNAD